MKRFSAKTVLSLALAFLLVLSLGVPAFAATTVVSNQALEVNGKAVDCEKYNIDGYNFFKLRDLAMLLNGTNSQFAVAFDEAGRTVSITTGEAYTPVGGELTTDKDQSASCVESTWKVEVDGEATDILAYNIGGSNFFKLRDLGQAVHFYVHYDETTRTAQVDETDEDEAWDTGDASKDDPRNQDDIGENELLVVSFGTSFNESRAPDIKGIEDAIAKARDDSHELGELKRVVNSLLQNIDDFIDYNVTKSLNNILEEHKIHDKENTARRVASVLELKKRIAKTKLQKESLYNGILTEHDAKSWFYDWYNGLLCLSDENEAFTYTDHGTINTRMLDTKSTEYKIYTEIFRRYLNNLGILKKSKEKENYLFKTFSLGILEQYFSLEQEEKTISQESIPNRDILNFMKKESAIFILAKDINQTNYIMYTKKVNSNERPYNYISSYTEKINPLWYNPYNRFADINLKILFRADSYNKVKRWPPFQNTNEEINGNINSLADYNNSGTEIIKTSNGTKTKQWIKSQSDLTGRTTTHSKPRFSSVLQTTRQVLH